MTDPARAFLNHGNVDQWTRGAGPITGIGTTMLHGTAISAGFAAAIVELREAGEV